MGQQWSSPPPPAGTVVYDLYGGPNSQEAGGCDQNNSCGKPSFDHAQFLPLMEPWISQAEFVDFKQRVCAMTQHYHGMSGKRCCGMVALNVVVMVLITIVGWLNGVPGLHGPYIILGLIAAFFLINRVVQHNNVVDNQVRGVLAEYQQRLAGRATISFVTQHTGLCKPKHARVMRQIWFSPPGSAGPAMSTHYAGGGYVVGMQQPHANMMVAPAPAGMTPTTMVPPSQQLQVPGTYAPGVGHPPPAYASASYPAAAAAAPPTQPVAAAAIQREVFYVTVPKGVESGQTFDAKTPSGRKVTVTAPTGAREGLEFQVSA